MEASTAANGSAINNLIVSIASYFEPEKMVLRGIVILIILVVAIILTKLVSKFFRDLQSHNRISSILSTLLRKTVKWVIWIVAIVAVLQTCGLNLTPVIAGLGVSGVVLGLALQETIASFFAGLVIAVKKPFEIGDYVTIDGTGGTVRSMDMMGITLTTPDNKLITMSNKNVWGSVIINTSALDKRRVDMVVSVGYGTDLGKAKKVISDLLCSYPEVLEEPFPVVEVNALSSSSIDFIARPWVSNADYWTFYWKFQKDIVEKLNENNIEIPFNKLDVNLVKGD